MRPRSGRRRYFVRTRYQGRFIAVFASLACAGAVATAVASGIAVDRALTEAMFRAHFMEQSTGDLVLPVLLTVNSLGAMAVLVCSAAAAAFLFRQASVAVDRICNQLAASEGHRDADGSTPREIGGSEWIADVAKAFESADESLRLRFAHILDQAKALETSAQQLEETLEQKTPSPAEEREAFEMLDRRITALKSELAQIELEDR